MVNRIAGLERNCLLPPTGYNRSEEHLKEPFTDRSGEGGVSARLALASLLSCSNQTQDEEKFLTPGAMAVTLNFLRYKQHRLLTG